MSPSEIPPGWHPDPANPSAAVRWWDGTQWTEHARAYPGGGQAAPGWGSQHEAVWGGPAAGLAPAHPPPVGYHGYGGGPYDRAASNGSSYGGFAPAPSFARRNQGSLTAIGVAALYVMVAVTVHFVFIGIVPAMAAVRAFRRKESLAPVAAVAAAVAIVVSLTVLSGH
jgi:hypothetical protein